MQRLTTLIIFGLGLSLALVAFFGCSSSPTGGGGPQDTYYNITISVNPTTLAAGGAEFGKVSAWVTAYNSPVYGDTIWFTAASGGASSITPFAYTVDTLTTGTVPEVHYFPNSVTWDTDTIYARLLNQFGSTVASDTFVVNITH
ncbi:MAG: hypothetical protein C4524_08680 [Candidatus Zixiibacteriota bacterium]|nr:MAG: hypothetical protein C4524_08680 [candidate division Zixibacteria bacterium]